MGIEENLVTSISYIFHFVFDFSMVKTYEKILGKGENADNHQFLLFPECLKYIFSNTNFNFWVTSINFVIWKCFQYLDLFQKISFGE